MKSMKKVYACVLALVCCLGFAACGDKEKAAPKVTTTSAPTTKAPETTTATTTKKEETTPKKSNVDVIKFANYTARVDRDKWSTSEDPNGENINVRGIRYEWTHHEGGGTSPRINFTTIDEYFPIEDYFEKTPVSENDKSELILLMAEDRLNPDVVDILISEIVQHSGVNMSHLSWTAGSNMKTEEYLFMTGTCLYDIMFDYNDNEEGREAYDDFVTSVLDDLSFKE